MKFKKSKIAVEKNSKVWTKSLVKCREIQNVEISLSYFKQMPKQKDVIGRFYALAKEGKSKDKRYAKISEEIFNLWIKLKTKQISVGGIQKKVKKMILSYQNHLKRPNDNNFNEIFDVSSEIESLSEQEPVQNINSDDSDLSSISEDYTDENLDDDNYKPPGKQNQHKLSLNPAVTLVNNVNVSTKKAAKICKQLAGSGITIGTPTQPGIYKAVIRSAKQKEEELAKTLKKEDWCLHFDGKKIGKKEVQVIVIKNEYKEVKLGVLVLDSGKSLDIFNGIKDTLDRFDLWNCIKMIVCDTTSVNTGNKNGVVRLLKNYFESIFLPPPQYVGCQHHILDLVLRYVMDEILGGKTSSPNIHYDFVVELQNNYIHLKNTFNQNDVVIKCMDIKWRGDMQFLFELGKAFRYYNENGSFPFINFKSLPPMSNARWNSRAIFAILAFILLPNYREKLLSICKFICGPWYDVWFSDHCFRTNNFSSLKNSLTPFKKAQECFLRHWVQEPSAINRQQRSNICAERAVKIVQDLFPLCKSTRTLNLKFISCNT